MPKKKKKGREITGIILNNTLDLKLMCIDEQLYMLLLKSYSIPNNLANSYHLKTCSYYFMCC